MENFKKATRVKLRFNTPVGVLSTEQLWDLSITQLDNLAVSLEQKKEESGKKSFIRKTSEQDAIAALRFEIVLDILNTKVSDAEKAAKRAANKEERNKLLKLIEEKKEGALAGLSIEELEKKLNELEEA
jgi:hypothetical protein